MFSGSTPRTTHSNAAARLLGCFALCMAVSGQPASAQQGLTLHDAVDQAFRGPRVQALDADVQQAHGLVRQAGLRPNPRLYLQSEDLRPWAPNYDFPNQTENYGYLGQSFELAGKRSRRLDFARDRLAEAEANREVQKRQLAGAVAAAYWTAVVQQRTLVLLGEDLAAVDDMVRYHKERVDAGAMKGVDLLRMQIEQDRLRMALQTAEQQATQARLALFREMGVSPNQAIPVDPLEDSLAIAPMSEEAVLAQRPDVQAARDAVRSAEADLKLQHANAVPDADLFGGYKRNAADNTAYGGLQFTLPVWNRNQGEVERARASIVAAKARLAALEQQVRTEVKQATANYEAQRTIVQQTIPQMQEHARKNLAILREAYRIGGVDLLRYIDAERTAFEIDMSALHALAQLRQNATQLQLVYGVQP